MVAAMRPEKLLELIRARPFVPLRVHITRGQSHDIRHPDQIIVLRGRVDIGVATGGQNGVAERVDRVSLIHVVRVEELGPRSPSETVE